MNQIKIICSGLLTMLALLPAVSIAQDKAWFFASGRWWRLDQFLPGTAGLGDDGGQVLDDNRITRPMWKVYYLTRNGMRVARAAAGPWLYPLALLWYLRAWFRKARFYDPDERPAYRKMLRIGLWDGLRGVRGRHPDYPPQR